jgi:serine/threonine protein kinase
MPEAKIQSPSERKISAISAAEELAETISSGPEAGPVSPDANFLPPDFLKGFTIVGDRPIGKGGMGVVWRAVQLSTRREVALKFIRADILASDAARARFEREVQLAAALEHPHIVRVYDSGVQGSHYFYVMELIVGSHLERWVEQHALSPRKIVELMTMVCEAVGFAHHKGIIHRDLKPSNILVSNDGRPHVGDFGLAKSLNGTDAAMTSAGVIAGTPPYMSPEQREGSVSLDARSDVYALGLILFRLLTSRLPTVSQERWTSEQCQRIAASLRAIVDKAIEPIRSNRYSDAAELGKALQDHLLQPPQMEPVRADENPVDQPPSDQLGTGRSRLLVIMFTDLVESTTIKDRLRTSAYLPILRRHDALLREAVASSGGTIQQDTGDGGIAVFATSSDAVNAALRFQWSMHGEQWPDGLRPFSRIGIHLGEVAETEVRQDGGNKIVGMAIDLASRVMSLAQGGQILMTRNAYNDARQFIAAHPAQPEVALKWVGHGHYHFKGSAEPLEIFEVGGEGQAPFSTPPDSDKARSVPRHNVEPSPGLRQAAGPSRANRSDWFGRRRRAGIAALSIAAFALLAISLMGYIRASHRMPREPVMPQMLQSDLANPSAAHSDPARADLLVPPAPLPVVVPARLAGRETSELLKLAYEGAPPAPAPGTPPPRIQVGILTNFQSTGQFVSLENDQTLTSGSDEYALAARPATGGFLYVFQIDSSGRAEWLFPRNPASEHSSGSNPVSAGQRVRIPPEPAKVMVLDDVIGIEHVYFVMSAARWPALEAVLGRPSQQPIHVVTRGPGFEQNPSRVLQPNDLGLRGIKWIQTGTTGRLESFDAEAIQGDQLILVPIHAPIVGGRDSVVVAERYFRHVGR